MSKAKHKEGIKALQDLLPIEDCINCGADDDNKNAKRIRLPDHVPKGHPNLIG